MKKQEVVSVSLEHDSNLVEALILLQVGWATPEEGKAYQNAYAMLRRHVRIERLRQELDGLEKEHS